MDNDVVTLGIREYTRNAHKYLYPAKYVVTYAGKPKYVVTITDYKEPIVRQINSVPQAYNTYGCGCLKKEGHTSCTKHQRI